jgi:hypothetical protein
MTERALPSVGVGARSRPIAGGHVGPIARPKASAVDRPVVARKEAVLSTPARAGMLLGATAAIYAVTLAGISGLQAESDGAIAAARAPYLDDLATTRAANDAYEARITRADRDIHALIGSYGFVGGTVTAFQTRLDALAALVADVEGSAAALPTRIKLPTVTTVRVTRSSGSGTTKSKPPATGGNTGASGG